MSLDEFLYGKVVAYFKKRKQKRIEQLNNIIKLEEVKPKLTVIARAITGKPVNIFPAEKEGGYKNHSFFLPPFFPYREIPEFPEELALQFYLFRTLFLCSQLQMNINAENENLPETIAREQALKHSPKILEHLFREFPSMEPVYQKLKKEFLKHEIELQFLYGKFMYSNKQQEEQQNLNNKILKNIREEIKTIIKSKPVEEIKSISVDKKQQEDYVLNHYFEKVETAEEFSGVWRDFDGDDDLKKHNNALDELKMKYAIREDEPIHSVYQTEFIENTSIPESAEAETKANYILYDEWDYTKRKYKPDFCKVFPVKVIETDPNYYKETIRKYSSTLTSIRKMIASLNNKYKRVLRQTDGQDFDLDALIDLYVDINTRHTPSEKIYISKRKKEKDISILMLLDLSLSSDGYAANNRIIDVEKQISILFGEILDEYIVDFAICGFYSKTRNNINFMEIKGFNDEWQKAKLRVGAIQPEGYTRIGPAIRHAGTLLAERPTKNKWLLLISDGKPNDYDKYEGKYGINDIKQALRELNALTINSYAFAIEAQAKYYLPQMFGQNHFQILTNPIELLKALVKLYDKIKHS